MPYKIEPYIDTERTQYVYDEETIQEINSKNLKLINKSIEYGYNFVCFNFALDDIDNWICSCEEAFEELERDYKQIRIKDAKIGDLISYHELCDYDKISNTPSIYNALHFAKIVKTNGTIKGTIIHSKWGSDGVFESSLEEVPDLYGNAIVVWRIK